MAASASRSESSARPSTTTPKTPATSRPSPSAAIGCSSRSSPGRGQPYNPGLAAVPQPSLPVAPTHVPASATTRLRWNYARTYAVTAAAVLILTATVTYLWQHRTQSRPLTDKDVLVLADFTNSTADPVFDGTLRQGVAIQLEQSPFLKIMDDEQVQRTMRLMSLAPGAHITNQIAHDVCVRDGAAATIGGSIASLGKTYVITLQAISCLAGSTLAREQIQANNKEQVLSALGTVTTALAHGWENHAAPSIN